MQKPPNGKIVAQVHYASRLPGFVARQDYLGRHFTMDLRQITKENVTFLRHAGITLMWA
jgi:hypothetical protein